MAAATAEADAAAGQLHKRLARLSRVAHAEVVDALTQPGMSFERAVPELWGIAARGQFAAAAAVRAWAARVDDVTGPRYALDVLPDPGAFTVGLDEAAPLLSEPVGRVVEPPPGQAASEAFNLLGVTRLVRQMIRSAGDDATRVASSALPSSGYVRVLTLPSCKHCAILAGKRYRNATPFARHPGCDCTNRPLIDGVDRPFDAREALNQVRARILAGDVRGLSEADIAAIRDGASPSQVINADGFSRHRVTVREAADRGDLEAARIAQQLDENRALGVPNVAVSGYAPGTAQFGVDRLSTVDRAAGTTIAGVSRAWSPGTNPAGVGVGLAQRRAAELGWSGPRWTTDRIYSEYAGKPAQIREALYRFGYLVAR